LVRGWLYIALTGELCRAQFVSYPLALSVAVLANILFSFGAELLIFGQSLRVVQLVF